MPGVVTCMTLITFSFMGPTLQTHVESAPFYLDSSGVSIHGLLQFDCGVPCEQRGDRAHLERARRGCDRSVLHLGTWFDVPAAGPCNVCVLRATADHRCVCLDGFPRIFCRRYHDACGRVDDEACCLCLPWLVGLECSQVDTTCQLGTLRDLAEGRCSQMYTLSLAFSQL